jgi:hypothetical protein
MRFAKLVVVSLVALVGLALASPAWAAYAPRFGASSNDTSATFTYIQAASDDPAAQLIFYIPVDYVADLGDVGFSVGKATAKATAADLGGSTLSLDGTIDPANATDTVSYGGANITLSAGATACTGTATHDAFWVLNLKASGNTLQVPVYVDRVPTTDPLVAVAWFRLTACLPPPDVPAGTPGRAAFGAKLTEATLNLEGTTAGTPGWHAWIMKATPYNPGVGTRNTAGAVEVQSFDRALPTLALVAKHQAANRVLFAGRVTAGGNSKILGGVTVTILDKTKPVVTIKTTSSGTFKALVSTTAARVHATAVAPPVDIGTSCTSMTGATCIAQTRGGFTVSSKLVRIT